MAKIRRAYLGLPSHCIFCDRPLTRGMTLSGEHLWSEWMHKKNRLLPADSSSRIEEVANYQVGHRIGTYSRWVMNGTTRHIKLRVICALCNNGWMSKLDNQIILVAERLLKGEPLTLTKDVQTHLAEWIALKVLVADHAPRLGEGAKSIFDAATLAKFMKDQKVPPGFTIWIGPGGGPEWREAAKIHRAGVFVSPIVFGLSALKKMPPIRQNVCTMTWGAGYAVFSIVAVSDPSLYGVDWETPFGHFQIWPVRERDGTWAPNYAIADWKITEISMRHNRNADSPMPVSKRTGNPS